MIWIPLAIGLWVSALVVLLLIFRGGGVWDGEE